MKIAGCFFITVLVVTFAACTNNKQAPVAKTSDTLTYNNKVVEELAADCKEKRTDSQRCGYARITYPVFKKETLLNDSIEKRLLTILEWVDTLHKAKDIKSLAKRFISVYDSKPSKADSDSSAIRTTLDCETSVQQFQGFIVLNIDVAFSPPFPHDFNYTYYLNWDTKANRVLYLKDILKKGSEGQFLKIAEKTFRTQEELSADADLSENMFDFRDNKFAINNNYCFTKEGVHFYYNIYDIRSYPNGPLDLLIPYQSFKHLLQPNTVISKYVK